MAIGWALFALATGIGAFIFLVRWLLIQVSGKFKLKK